MLIFTSFMCIKFCALKMDRKKCSSLFTAFITIYISLQRKPTVGISEMVLAKFSDKNEVKLKLVQNFSEKFQVLEKKLLYFLSLRQHTETILAEN